MKTINVAKLHVNATLPTRAYTTDAGIDLYSLRDVSYKKDTDVITVETGIAIEIPEGYVGLVRDRSSVSKQGLKVTAGVVDAGYTGDISAVFLNIAKMDGCIRAGQKIAQILIVPIALPQVVEVSSLKSSARGSKGFGSSGS